MLTPHENIELGRAKLRQGEYLAALTCADTALGQEAASFEALQLRSRALFLLGRDTEALQVLRKVHAVLHQPLALLPDPDEMDAPGPEPEITAFDGSGSEALETLLALRERYQLDDDLLMLLAELAEDAGRYEIAREAYDELTSIAPARQDAWEGRVHLLCHEDLDQALQVVRDALKRFPSQAVFYEFLGYIYFRRRLYRQAIAAYRTAITHGTEHMENYESLIQCYLALNDTEAALELTRVLAHQHPNDPEAFRFAVEVTINCGHLALALEHTHQLLRVRPSHAEAYCYKAWVEVQMGDWALAERSLRLGFYKAIDSPDGLFELVDLLLDSGQADDAMRVATLLESLAPDHPESSAARGRVLREIGAYPEAYNAFDHAAALSPQDDTYQTWMGIVLDNMGEYHAAIRLYTRVLSRHPADVWTLTNRGLSYLALEMLDRALTDFNLGLDLDPEEGPLYFWRACARLKRGEPEIALGDLRRAVDMSEEIYEWLDAEPLLDALRPDPRFQALMRTPDEDH